MVRHTFSSISHRQAKSEKTIRRWIKDGKLKAENRGGGYLIKREDLAAIDKRVTKEWQEGSELGHIRLQVSLMEGQVEYLRVLVDAQQGEIEELQRQVKRLTPKTTKKAPARKKTTTARTTRRKQDEDFW